MQSFNMVNTAGCFNINTGGRVNVFDSSIKGEDGKWRPTTKDDYQNDKGRLSMPEIKAEDEQTYKPVPEKNWEKREREMTERARNYYPNPRESALERELWNQVTGGNRGAANVSPKLAADYAAYQSRLSRESSLEQQQKNQNSNIS